MNYDAFKAVGDTLTWHINRSGGEDLDDLKAYVEELLSLEQKEFTDRLGKVLDVRWNMSMVGGGSYTNLLMDPSSYGYTNRLSTEINEQIQCSIVAIQKAFNVYLPIMEDKQSREFTNDLCGLC